MRSLMRGAILVLLGRNMIKIMAGGVQAHERVRFGCSPSPLRLLEGLPAPFARVADPPTRP